MNLNEVPRQSINGIKGAGLSDWRIKQSDHEEPYLQSDEPKSQHFWKHACSFLKTKAGISPLKLRKKSVSSNLPVNTFPSQMILSIVASKRLVYMKFSFDVKESDGFHCYDIINCHEGSADYREGHISLHVSPIFKKGPKFLAENYRPVSLRLEHLKQKQNSMDLPNIYLPQILSYLGACALSITRRRVVDGIYFHFAMAFDTVHYRPQIAEKTEVLRNQWDDAFWLIVLQLADKVNGEMWKKVEFKVDFPKECSWYPLFVLFINDLPVKTTLYLFTNTKLFEEVKSLQDALRLHKQILIKWKRQSNQTSNTCTMQLLNFSLERMSSKKTFS